jgi:putative N6-adenine-specific DNA methylase
LENARKAGVERYISAEVRDISKFAYPADEADCPPRLAVKVITNPPYAERMLEKADTERIYKTMGERLTGENLYVITSDGDFEALFGRKADKNRKLYNGMLMCRLYVYN